MSKTRLVIHQTPSPYTQEMFEAVAAGATDAPIEGARSTCLRLTATCSAAHPVGVLMVSGLLLARAGLFEELRTGRDGPTEPPR